MTHTHHTLDYVEIAAPDLAASTAFYTAAFGWSFNDYDGVYAGIRSADGEDEVGGLDAGATAGTGGPLVMLYSDDLDSSVEAVRSAGGEIVKEPYDVPGVRRFLFRDPAGNELGVWTEA